MVQPESESEKKKKKSFIGKYDFTHTERNSSGNFGARKIGQKIHLETSLLGADLLGREG